MAKYRVGQMVRVRFVGFVSLLDLMFEGTVTTITKVGVPKPYKHSIDGTWYELEVGAIAHEKVLVPINDGDRASTWDEMEKATGWRPANTETDIKNRTRRKPKPVKVVYGE